MECEYRLVQTQADEKWNEFVKSSSNGTIFSDVFYLKSSGVNYKLYYCYKKDELRAGISLIESEDGKNIILDDLVIYNGIMYNKPTNKQNHSQQISEQFAIQEFVMNELTNIYQNIEISLHPSIVDIRAILWVNYNSEKAKYTPSIRYTSYIDISDFRVAKQLEDISIYNKASVSRRQQIRYAMKKNYQLTISQDTQTLIEFYKKTMNRQTLEVEQSKLDKMYQLSNGLLQNNMAKIYASYDEKNEIGSMALFGFDNKRAYYIFGANEPSKRDGHSGTHVLWEAFDDLSKMGIDEVDLEGINSPRRGWFKLSFGGDVIPYYEINYKQGD